MPYKIIIEIIMDLVIQKLTQENEHTTHDECNLLNSWIFNVKLDDCNYANTCKYKETKKNTDNINPKIIKDENTK